MTSETTLSGRKKGMPPYKNGMTYFKNKGRRSTGRSNSLWNTANASTLNAGTTQKALKAVTKAIHFGPDKKGEEIPLKMIIKLDKEETE